MNTHIGSKYGHWTVIALARPLGDLHIYTIRCVCGKEKERAQSRLTDSNSCGCQNKRECAKRPDQAIADSGMAVPEPHPVPSFDDVSQSRFTRKAKYPMWEIYRGAQVIDRQPMTLAERRQQKQAQQ